MHSLNPIENTGEVLGRYGLGLGVGGALGEVGHVLGGRGAQQPAASRLRGGDAGAQQAISGAAQTQVTSLPGEEGGERQTPQPCRHHG